tara:strand:+ start:923 stop:1630 length:708 start_codon:yes stop_codon:yes gene_type:complete
LEDPEITKSALIAGFTLADSLRWFVNFIVTVGVGVTGAIIGARATATANAQLEREKRELDTRAEIAQKLTRIAYYFVVSAGHVEMTAKALNMQSPPGKDHEWLGAMTAATRPVAYAGPSPLPAAEDLGVFAAISRLEISDRIVELDRFCQNLKGSVEEYKEFRKEAFDEMRSSQDCQWGTASVSSDSAAHTLRLVAIEVSKCMKELAPDLEAALVEITEAVGIDRRALPGIVPVL